MLPLVSTLRGYRRDTFRADLIAGLTVAVMLVPQAMAYAVLAGMPPVSGLYAAIVPLAVYAVLGTSGSLAVGPVAIISLLTAAALAPLANGDPVRHATLAATLALMVGAIQVLLGAIRAGRLVSFLSHGVISGFTSAAAIVIAVSQIPSLLGLEAERSESFLSQLAAIGGAIDSPGVTTTVVGVQLWWRS
jgi:sulfate permease, SulP family